MSSNSDKKKNIEEMSLTELLKELKDTNGKIQDYMLEKTELEQRLEKNS